MTTTAEQRIARCPLRLTTRWSAYSAGHCFRRLGNGRPRPSGWQEMSSRLSRDLDQLSCFLEDAEAKCSSVKKPGSIRDQSRYIDDEVEAPGVEPTTGDHRRKELDEQLSKEDPTNSSKATGADDKCRADQNPRQILETPWFTKTKVDPTQGKPNREIATDFTGIKEVTKDSRGMKTTNEDFGGTKNLRGITKVNEDSRGRKKVTENFRNEAISLENEYFGLSKRRQGDTGKPGRLPTGTKRSHVELEQELEGESKHATAITTDHQSTDVRRNQSSGNLNDPETGSSGKLGERKMHRTDIYEAPVQNLTNAISEGESNCSTPNKNIFEESDATQFQVARSEDAHRSVAVVAAAGVKLSQSSGTDKADENKNQSSGTTNNVSVARRFFSIGTNSRLLLNRLESGDQLPKSTDWKDVSDEWIQEVRERERRRVACTRSTRSRSEADDKRKESKPEEWIHQKPGRVEDCEEKERITKNEEEKKKEEKKEKEKNDEEKKQEEKKDAEKKETEKNEEEKKQEEKKDAEKKEKEKNEEEKKEKEKKERNTKQDEEEEEEEKKEEEKEEEEKEAEEEEEEKTKVQRKENNSRNKETDNKKNQEKDNKRTEKTKVRKEMDEKMDLIQMHLRWLGIVSEYASLLARDGNGVSKMTAMGSLQPKSIQFENDYRRLATKKEVFLKNIHENLKNAAGPGGDDNDADDDDGGKTVDKGEKELEKDALEGPQPNIQQQQQSYLHPHSMSNDQSETKPEEVQRLRVSRSSNERPQERSSPDIQKTRSDVTLSRSPTKEVTEQDKEGYKDGHKDLTEVGYTRSAKSVVGLSHSEKLRYIHPLRQFETDTRAEQQPDGDWGTKSRLQMASVDHVGRARNAIESKVASSRLQEMSCEEKKMADEGIRSRILCEGRRSEVTGNVDKSVVFFALRSKPSEDGRQAELPSAAPNRRGKGLPARGHSCCSSKEHSIEPSLQVEGSSVGNSVEKYRSIGTTRLPNSKVQTERAACGVGSQVAAVFGDVSPAAEAKTEESSSTLPPRVLSSPPTSAAPSFAGIRNNSNNSMGPKAGTQINRRTRTLNSPPDQQDSYDQPTWTGRRVAVRPSTWKRKMSTLLAEAENEYLKQNLSDDVNTNTGPNGDAICSKNRTGNNTVSSKNAPENNMISSKTGPKHNMVCSKNGPEDPTIRSKNDPVKSCLKYGPDETVVSSKNVPDEVIVASLRKKEITEKPCLLKPTVSYRFLGQKAGSSKRSQSQDRYGSLLGDQYIDPTEDGFNDIWQDRFNDSSDAGSAEPDGCCEGKKLGTMRVKDRVEMLEFEEKLRSEFRTGKPDPRHLLVPASTEKKHHRKRMHEEMEDTEDETDDGDDEEDDVEGDNENCGSLDLSCYWPEGDICEKLLLTESDQEPVQNDDTVSTEEKDPIPDTPVELIIPAEHHWSRLTATRPIPDIPVQLLTSAEPHRSCMTASPVATPKVRSRFALFRLVKDALTGLNRRLRSNDFGEYRMQDQRVIIALIVCMIALLFVFVMADCPISRQR